MTDIRYETCTLTHDHIQQRRAIRDSSCQFVNVMALQMCTQNIASLKKNPGY